jgi:GTP-binding protein
MMDRAEVTVKAGDGGNGCIAFRREKYVPRGGPYGGDGGNGGSVVFYASESVATLIDLQYSQRYSAMRGGHGEGKGCQGADGDDIRVPVPVGTSIYDADTGELLFDLSVPGAEAVVAKGGSGGHGNRRFKSNAYRAPRVAELGEPGSERRLRLEVRLIADAAFIGFPNAGKSTLLAHVSDAKPKIGDYPFTTLSPNLGVVRLAPGENMVIADMPGLIEGAHAGAGLGNVFLRHAERARLLLHVLDAAGVDGRDPLVDFHTINRELRLHSEDLARTQQIVVLNKSDLPAARANLPRLRDALAGKPVFIVSGVTGEGLPELMGQTYIRLAELRRRSADVAPTGDVIRYDDRSKTGIRVIRRAGAFVVEGDAVRRAVVMTDFGNDEAIWFLHRRLTRMGVIRLLQRAGASDGDTIHIGDAELVFHSGDAPLSFADYLASRRPAARRQGRNEHADGRNANAR